MSDTNATTSTASSASSSTKPSTTSDAIFGEDQANSSTFGRWTLRIQPRLDFQLRDSRTISIPQNAKGFGELGSRVWDGGLVLSRYLEQHCQPLIRNQKVIELGSGTGLSGIVAAALGAEVVMTDKAALLRLLRHNVNINSHLMTPTDGTPVRVIARELFWGQPATQLLTQDATHDTYTCQKPCAACDTPLPPPVPVTIIAPDDDEKKKVVKREVATDVSKLPAIQPLSSSLATRLAPPYKFIIGSDLTYDFEDLPPLLETAAELMGSHDDGAQWILAYGEQRAAIPTFFAMASDYFDVKYVDKQLLDFSDIPFPTFSISICHITVKKHPTGPHIVKDVELPAELFIPAPTATPSPSVPSTTPSA